MCVYIFVHVHARLWLCFTILLTIDDTVRAKQPTTAKHPYIVIVHIVYAHTAYDGQAPVHRVSIYERYIHTIHACASPLLKNFGDNTSTHSPASLTDRELHTLQNTVQRIVR